MFVLPALDFCDICVMAISLFVCSLFPLLFRMCYFSFVGDSLCFPELLLFVICVVFVFVVSCSVLISLYSLLLYFVVMHVCCFFLFFLCCLMVLVTAVLAVFFFEFLCCFHLFCCDIRLCVCICRVCLCFPFFPLCGGRGWGKRLVIHP